MNIFISWSGMRSKKAAKELQSWLPKVIQVAKPWMSDDIPAGSDSLKEISNALDQAQYGVVCITADNMTSGFIIHETIELRNKVIAVCPYIIDLDIQRRNLLSPFNQLQAKMADLEGTKQLVLDINKALGSLVDVDTLRRAVDSNWEDLEKEFEKIRRDKGIDPEKIIQDFCEIFMDLNRHRASLNFSSSVDDAINLFVANQYNRETIIEHAFKALEESRNSFDRKSILVANVRDFLKEHFTKDDIGNIISRLEPILFSKCARNIKRDRLLRRIKIEELEVFLRFHRILIDKLKDNLPSEVLKEIQKMPPTQKRQILLESSEQLEQADLAAKERKFINDLRWKGVITEMPLRLPDEEIRRKFKRIEIKGEPLSETIIKERD